MRESEEEKARARNKVAPTGDLYEEMEDEIAKHEEQKKKLSKYLAFLLQKDGAGLAAANQRRMAAQRARANKGWMWKSTFYPCIVLVQIYVVFIWAEQHDMSSV